MDNQGGAIRADLDGLRALGDLMMRQSLYLASAREYLHQHCQATGAFDGVLAMFRGPFSAAFADAAEGLQISCDADQLLAERFRATAANYESADRSSYDRLAQLARANGWDVAAYATAGSGNATARAGICPSPGPVGPPAAGGDDAVSRRLKQGMEHLKTAQMLGAPKTVTVNGSVVFADDLRQDNEHFEKQRWGKIKPDGTPFDAQLEPYSDAAKQIEKTLDPAGALKEKILESGSGWARDRTDHRLDRVDPESAHRITQGMSWAKDAKGFYETAQAFDDDWTMGVKGSVQDLHGAMSDENRYLNIAHSEGRPAMRDALNQDGR